MVNIVLILAMLVACLGAVTYGLISGIKTLQTNIDKLIIEDRLEETAQAIIANTVSTTTSSTQTYYVPTPNTSGSYAAVPSWVTPNAQTPRGVAFAYCPFSNISNAGTGTALTTPTSSYTITTGSLYTGSQSYVITSYVAAATAARPANASSALAIIVAPGPNQTASPDCLSVTAGGTLAGAQVRIINEADVQSHAQVIASAGSEFYAAVTASGDTTGRSSSNPAAFSTVMTYVSQYRPQAVKIDMASGTYTVDTTMGETGTSSRQFSKVRNHSVLFAGAGTGSTLIEENTASTTNTSSFIGNIEFQSAGMPAVNGQVYKPFATNLGNIILDGAQMQYLGTYNNGRVYVVGTTTMSGNNSTGALGTEFNSLSAGGEFFLGGYLGSSITAPTSATFLSTNGLFQLDQGSRLVMGQTAIYIEQGGDTATKPWFWNTRGSELVVEGTLSQTAGLNTGFVDITLSGSRSIYSDAFFNGTNSLYDYLSSTAGVTALDRGTVINTISGATGPKSIFYLSGGGEVDLTSSAIAATVAGSNAMNTSGIIVSDNAHTDGAVLGGGITGGWGVTNATPPTLKSTGTVCFTKWATSPDAAMYLTDDSKGTLAANSFLPQGTSGKEPLIIVNRAGWTCN